MAWWVCLTTGPLLGQSYPNGALETSAGRDPITLADSLSDAGYHILAAQAYTQIAKSETNKEKRALFRDKAAEQFAVVEALDSAILLYELNYNLSSDESRVLDSLRARAYHQAGVIFLNAGEADVSYPLFLEAADLRKSLYPSGHEDLLLTLRNLAIYHTSYTIHTDSAKHYIERATAIMDGTSVRPLVKLLTFQDQAKIYAKLLDQRSVRSASRLIDRTISAHRAELDSIDVAFAYYDLADFCRLVQDYDQVIRYAILAREYLAQLGFEDWAASVQLTHAAALQKKDIDSEALKIYKESRETLKAYADYAGLHVNHYNAGLIAIDQRLFQTAETELKNAQRYALLYEDSLGFSNAIHALARLDLDRGRLDDAKRGFERVLKMYLPSVVTHRPTADEVPIEKLKLTAEFFDDRTDYFVARNDLPNASADLYLVFALFDRIRTELPAAESQRFVSEQLRPFFQQGIHLQYLQYQEDGDESHLWAALELSERAKAFSLLQQRAMASRERPAREREIIERINKLERAGLEGTDQEGLLAAARLQLRRLQQASLEEIPDPEPMDADALMAYLSERNLHLIEYALGEEHNYRFELGPDSTISMQPMMVGNLGDKIEKMRQALRAGAFSGPDLRSDAAKASDATYRRLARQLAEVLLPEVLAGKDKLLIVPDGVLGYLPFGALLVDNHSSSDFQSLPYLARGREVHYSYSARYLLLTESEQPPAVKQAILALAPSFAGDADVQEAQSNMRSIVLRGDRAIPGLLPLLHNEAEVRQIAELFPDRTKVLVGPDARREVFMERADRYALLHLSSHALVDPERPELSFVAFSQRGDSLESEELLLLLDLAALELKAELAVLSACETGVGKIAEGEGVLSLAQAFSTAGAESTLTTLWKVDDAATKELMGTFYTALADGQSRAQALSTAAQAAIAGNYAHPYYWSGLSLYGPGDVLSLPPRPSKLGRILFWSLMAMVTLIIGATLMVRLRSPAKGEDS